MNRQVVAFLSLVSLVLVLSVYYIMIPSGTLAPVGNVPDLDGEVADGRDFFFSSLAAERNENHQIFIDSQEEILFSSNYSSNDKAVALEAIDRENKVIKDEGTLEKTLINAGYPEAFVKLSEVEILVYVFKANQTIEDVVDVMNKVGEVYNSDLQITVKFKG